MAPSVIVGLIAGIATRDAAHSARDVRIVVGTVKITRGHHGRLSAAIIMAVWAAARTAALRAFSSAAAGSVRTPAEVRRQAAATSSFLSRYGRYLRARTRSPEPRARGALTAR